MTSRDRYLKELTINKMSRQDKYKSNEILTALQEYYNLNQKKEDGTLSSFQEKLKLAYLKVFFKNIVDGDDVSNFKKCSKTDYECFQEEYKRAKELIERETGKYNIIISKYLELVDKSIYNYSDIDDVKKFEKYIQYLSRKIKTLMNKTSLNATRPDVNKNEFLTNLFKPIPNTFRLSDINDFAEDKVKPENFSRFTPDQIESISAENLHTLTEKQLSYINADGWDRLGKRVNDIDSAKLKKVNSKGMYKQLNPDKLTELFIYNPYKYIEEFDGPLLDRLTVDFDVPEGSSGRSSYFVGGATNPYRFTLNDTDLLLKFLRKITRKISYDHFNQISSRNDFGDKMFEIIIDKLDYKEIIERLISNNESAAQNLMDLVSTNKISQQLILKFLENILKHYKTTSIDSVDAGLIMLITQIINNIRKNARVGADGADNDTADGADNDTAVGAADGADNDTAPPAYNDTNRTNIEPLNTLDKFANSASILTAMQRTNESSNNKNVTKVLQKVGKIAKIGATAVSAAAALPFAAVLPVVAAAKAIKSKMNNGTNGTDIEPQVLINTLDKIANSASILTAMQSRSGMSERNQPRNLSAIIPDDNEKEEQDEEEVQEVQEEQESINLNANANNASILTAIQSTNEKSETSATSQTHRALNGNNQQKGVLGNNRVASIPDLVNENDTSSFIAGLEKLAEPLGIITGISRTNVSKGVGKPAILNNARNKDIADRGFTGILDIKQENGATDDDEEENDTNNVIEKLGNLAEAAGIITGISRTGANKSTNQTRILNSAQHNVPTNNLPVRDHSRRRKANALESGQEESEEEDDTSEEKLEDESGQEEDEDEEEENENYVTALPQSENMRPETRHSKESPANALRKELSEIQERIPPLSAQYHRTLYSSRKNVKPITPSVSPATRVVVPGGAPSKDNSRTLVSKEMKRNESTGTDFRDDLENWIDFYKEEKVKAEIDKFKSRIEKYKEILNSIVLETNKENYTSLNASSKQETQQPAITSYQKELERVKKDIEGKLGELSTTNLKETIQKSLEINTNILNQSQFSQYFTDTKYDTFKENVKTYNRHLNKLLDKYEENNKKINENDIKNIITDLKNAINIITDLKKRNSVNENVEKAESLKARLNKNLESIITSESEFFKKEKDDIDKSNNAIKGQLDSVLTKLKKNARSTVSKAVDGSDISSKLTTESLFSRLWKNYLNDLNDENQIIEEAQDKLYRSYKSNNLDPEQALALSQDDKIIFVVIIFVIRQISLAITETMIDYDIIKNLYNALISYVGFYALLIIIIITVVNIDDYKLRIVFNFFNMHINQPGIFGHIFILIGLFVLIYMLIKQMYKDIDTDKAKLTEIEKMRLVYRIELMSIFIFVVTSILVLAT
jgi:hypothetical protein